MRNESSVDVAVHVLQLATVRVQDLAGSVTIFPPTEVWPVLVPHGTNRTIAVRLVHAGTEISHNVIFERADNLGMVCWPIDGSPALPGGLFTVEE